MNAVSERSPLDRCPGLLRPFIADDGALVRLRIPGGRVPVSVLSDVTAIAASHGTPVLQLTSRGNIQLRALPVPLPESLIEAVEETGLLPSSSHERVRNIVAAPLAPALGDLVAALDSALCADPLLARLPGRFLFAVSDASGSVLSERWDVAYQQTSGSTGTMLVGGLGREVSPGEAVGELIAVSRTFVATAPQGAWNVRDLPADSPVFEGLIPSTPVVAPPLLPGVVRADVVAGVPLGMLTREHVDAMARVAETIAITPWRSIVVPDAADRAHELRNAGLVTAPDGPWARLSACVGAPSCRRTTVLTLDLARSAADAVTTRGLRIDRDVHVVGCERRCGTGPSHTVVIAPGSVDDVLADLSPTAIRGVP